MGFLHLVMPTTIQFVFLDLVRHGDSLAQETANPSGSLQGPCSAMYTRALAAYIAMLMPIFHKCEKSLHSGVEAQCTSTAFLAYQPHCLSNVAIPQGLGACRARKRGQPPS